MFGGLAQFLAAIGVLRLPTGPFPELGFWFVVLAAVTWAGAAASLATNAGLLSVLGLLAAGSTLMAIATFTGESLLQVISGYVFMASAVLAWYTASAIMLEETHGRVVLPIGKTEHAQRREPYALGLGEPGVVHGQ